MKSLFLVFCLTIQGVTFISSQSDTIKLINASLEGVPQAGSISFNLPGWDDCLIEKSIKHTPPDIHPGGFFQVNKKPNQGNTYVGLVTRKDNSYEAITQSLLGTMKADSCYRLSLYLARSENYVDRDYVEYSKKNSIDSQASPVILQIFAGDDYCNGDLVAETPLVMHTEWKKYDFKFKAESDYDFITFSSYYNPLAKKPYKGNILIDNISDIIQETCTE